MCRARPLRAASSSRTLLFLSSTALPLQSHNLIRSKSGIRKSPRLCPVTKRESCALGLQGKISPRRHTKYKRAQTLALREKKWTPQSIKIFWKGTERSSPIAQVTLMGRRELARVAQAPKGVTEGTSGCGGESDMERGEQAEL